MKWELLNAFDGFSQRVFFPVGTIEPHGPLPVGTDNIAAEYFASALAGEFNALILPVLPFGVNRSLYGIWGAISISPQTFENVIYEVGVSLVKNGVKELVVFNGHGGNTQHLKEALYSLYTDTGLKCASIDWWVVDKDASKEVFGRVGGHGGIEEFAIVYLAYPNIGKSIKGKFKAFHPKPGISTYPSPRSVLLYEEGRNESYDINEESVKSFANRITDRIREVLKEIFSGWGST